MKVPSETLISDLVERTRQVLNDLQKLRELSEEELNWRPAPESWSILECIEHLNLYGDFYLPEIERRIKDSKHDAQETYHSGLFGNYFAKMMLPREKLNKMGTMKDKNPLGSQLDSSTLDKFIGQQKLTLELLNKARKVSLRKTKTTLSIPIGLKLRLGDTFRVIIYHNQRHMVQAKRVLKEYGAALETSNSG